MPFPVLPIEIQHIPLLGPVLKIKRLVLNDQNSNGGKVGADKKRCVAFVISGGDSAKSLNFLKKALNRTAFFIPPPVHRPWVGNIAPGRDGIRCPLPCDKRSNRLSAVCPVCRDLAPAKVPFFQSLYRMDRVAIIAWRQKVGAVRMVTEQGRQSTEVARELGVCIDTLRSWLKAAGVQAGQANRLNRDQQRIRELEAENRALRKQLGEKDEVIDVLKKSIGILSGP